MEKPVIYKNTDCQIKGNKTTQAAIYISKEDKVGGGEVVQGVLEKNIEEKSVEPEILSHILDALSQGIARSIVEAAVKSMSPIEGTYTNQGSV